MEKETIDREDGFSRRSREKRECILEAAGRLFSRQGLKKTSVAEVAALAGVSQVTVFKYFHDKKGLIEAALLRIAKLKEEEYRKTLGEKRPFAERFELYLRQKTESAGETRGELMKGLYDEYPELVGRLTQEKRKFFAEAFAPFLDEGRKEGFIASGLSNDDILAYLDLLAAGFAARPDLVGQVSRSKERFEAVKRLIFFGIVERRD